MKNSKLILRSLASSAGVVIYVAGVAWLMQNAQDLFGNSPNFNPMFAVTGFLMLFVFSATITGGLVLGYPAYLYFEGQKKDALRAFFMNLGFLALFLILIFSTMALWHPTPLSSG
ncbi:MAG: hypothetical protein WC641_04050 [Patescibacteria group bacterium]